MGAPGTDWRATTVAGVTVLDAVVGALLLLVAAGTLTHLQPPEGPLVVTLPVAVVMTTAVMWRSRAPLASLGAVLVAGQVQTWVATSPGTLWAFAVLLLSAYSVARFCPEERAALGGGLLVGSLWVEEWRDGGSDYVFIALVFGGAWLLGRAVRHWQERATTAELNQELLARSAVAEERVRIARELHDVVAHSLGVVSVQANAAEAALEHDPALASEPLSAIKVSTREALDEMRRLLSLLRTGDDDGPAVPPGLADLDGLVDSVRGAGLPVDVEVSGASVRLPVGVDISAYRIVQEALTNVLKHAGSVPTRVEVRYEPAAVTVCVVNALPQTTAVAQTATGGHGLVGMRERVSAHGGALVAGADPSGGYVVRARLPYAEAT
jgi:signal transduction histidine kinase